MKFREILTLIRPTDYVIHDHNNVSTSTTLDSNELNHIYVEIFRNNKLEKFQFGIKDDIPDDLLEANFIKMRVALHQRQTNAYLFFCSLVFTLII